MRRGTYYVYLIKSLKFPDKKYVGFTNDLEQRLRKHNEGASIYTSSFRPWSLVVSLSFDDKKRALQFEKYLKTGSGSAFAKKRLW